MVRRYLRAKTKSNGKMGKWRANKTKTKEEERHTMGPKPFYIHPKSFLILFMCPDLGMVGEGRHEACTTRTNGRLYLDVSRCDVDTGWKTTF